MNNISLKLISTLLISLGCTQSYAYKINLGTGEYLMDTEGSNSMNLETGAYQIDMKGSNSMNLETSEYLMDTEGGYLE